MLSRNVNMYSLSMHIPCLSCGYDLFGVPLRVVCPECGRRRSPAREQRRVQSWALPDVNMGAAGAVLWGLFLIGGINFAVFTPVTIQLSAEWLLAWASASIPIYLCAAIGIVLVSIAFYGNAAGRIRVIPVLAIAAAVLAPLMMFIPSIAVSSLDPRLKQEATSDIYYEGSFDVEVADASFSQLDRWVQIVEGPGAWSTGVIAIACMHFMLCDVLRGIPRIWGRVCLHLGTLLAGVLLACGIWWGIQVDFEYIPVSEAFGGGVALCIAGCFLSIVGVVCVYLEFERARHDLRASGDVQSSTVA